MCVSLTRMRRGTGSAQRHTFRRHFARWSCALVAAALALAAVPAARADNAPPNLTPPKAYYLALGDSLAYGFQQAKFDSEVPNVDPATFDTGYVDDFAARMAHLSKGLAIVNLGCPDETSDSMILGGPTPVTCGTGFPRMWLHHPYTAASQLDEAVAFLRAHPKQTSPVTIDIGGADLLATQQQCAQANGGSTTPAFLQCLQTQEPITIAHAAQNLTAMLRSVSAAAPTAEVIVVGLYNPQFALPGGDQLVEGAFNPTMASVAASFGAFFADPFPTIDHGAAYADEQTSVCAQIAICASPDDDHPFDNGYAAIADVVYAASGYGSLK
jgi:lysophospholipase L1-like esterase